METTGHHIEVSWKCVSSYRIENCGPVKALALTSWSIYHPLMAEAMDKGHDCDLFNYGMHSFTLLIVNQHI